MALQEASAMEPPAWLAKAFAGHRWRSLRSCSLRVHRDVGAGLDLEASEFGYVIDGVDETPGQEPGLRRGSVVIAIDGLQLLHLEEEALEKAFGSRFRDAVRLTLADADELQRAAAEQKSKALKESAETLEVAGLVMHSLPARKRRRRAAVENVDASTNSGGGGDVDESYLRRLPKEIRQFEYMDHTADVILHSWGTTLTEAVSQVCVAFFSYMTELDKVDMVSMVEVDAKGRDMLDMLYHLLDEFLFRYGSEYMICRRVEILEFDQKEFRIRARGYGERFDLKKHPQGTEIKAITMHQMKILLPGILMTEEGVIERKQSQKEGGAKREGFPFECYVLVDI